MINHLTGITSLAFTSLADAIPPIGALQEGWACDIDDDAAIQSPTKARSQSPKQFHISFPG